MDAQSAALVESLRTGAARLATDLSAVETNMAELYDAAAGRAGVGGRAGREPGRAGCARPRRALRGAAERWGGRARGQGREFVRPRPRPEAAAATPPAPAPAASAPPPLPFPETSTSTSTASPSPRPASRAAGSTATSTAPA